MNDREKILVEQGSVEAAAQQIGMQAASEALHSLSLRAPMEIQSSWPLVLAWAQLQEAHEMAREMGDAKMMIQATKEKAAILKDLY